MNDLISRQAAIDFIAAGHLCNPNEPRWSDNEVVNFLKSRPSAQRTGRWMFTDAAPHRVYCSECYKTFIPNKEWYAWAEHIVPRKYCPNCGARMEVQE